MTPPVPDVRMLSANVEVSAISAWKMVSDFEATMIEGLDRFRNLSWYLKHHIALDDLPHDIHLTGLSVWSPAVR